MKLSLIVFVFLAVALPSFAEYRQWTDSRGNKIEAEFAGVSGKKIVLRNRSGRKYKLSPSSLCSNDRKFLQGKVPDSLLVPEKEKQKPPRLDIEFGKNSDSHGSCYVDMTCSVTIEKKSSPAYDGELKAAFYAIGESRSRRMNILLDRSEHTFDFKTSRKVTLRGSQFTLYSSSGMNYGADFNGYLVVVYDAEGNEILVKATRSDYEDNRSKIAKFKKGRYFDRDYADRGVKSSTVHYYY